MKLDEIGHALREEQQHSEAQKSATFTTSFSIFLKTAKNNFLHFEFFSDFKSEEKIL